MEIHPIIQGYIDGNEFGRTFGMDFSVLSPGVVEYEMHISEKHLATPAAAHGGVIAAFVDAVLGVGALSKSCEFNNIVSTVEFKISYFNPALKGDTLIGRSKLLKAGKSIIFMEATIVNQNDIVIAKASGTFNQYPVHKILKDF